MVEELSGWIRTVPLPTAPTPFYSSTVCCSLLGTKTSSFHTRATPPETMAGAPRRRRRRRFHDPLPQYASSTFTATTTAAYRTSAPLALGRCNVFVRVYGSRIMELLGARRRGVCRSSKVDLESESSPAAEEDEEEERERQIFHVLWEWAVLVSPFFFWGTAMVAMKQVVPKAGPFFVGAFRLIPAGFLLIAYASSQRRKLPSGFTAWLSITLFALVDATCFQGFLAEGLQKTSAGLGSVIIDSQPLTVAVLAALIFGESIEFIGTAGLVLGVVGLLLLEVPALALDENNFSFWESGEWWMLLAAQSMAIGTVMVRWVSKYTDPVMATGWHMIIGGLPLVAISIVNQDPAFNGSFKELTVDDFSALLYTSIFGSAISYGVFFHNATKGSLTKLSSLTFLTPMFASVFGVA